MRGKLYHSSKHLFKHPVYEHIIANRTNHENGELGLWFSTTNSWQKGFGGYTYEFTLSGKQCKMPFKEFKDLCMNYVDEDYYKHIRQSWLEEGIDYISIVEKDGSIDMGIVINFDCIEGFGRMDEH